MSNIEQKKLSKEQIEAKIAQIKADLYKVLAPIVVASFMLTSCVPEGVIPETQATSGQTEEITLEPNVETEIVSVSPEATHTMTKTPTPENTPTATATPTPEATATPEPTPTATAIEIPTDIDWTGDLVVKEKLGHYIRWGPYDAVGLPIKIRPQDVHKNEPFTLLNGKYYVQVWADAWFREGIQEGRGMPIEDGPIYHITVPVVVWDTEENSLWKMQVGDIVQTWGDTLAGERLEEFYTGPFEENVFLTNDNDPDMIEMDDVLCFTPDGNRDCGSMNNYTIALGPIPQESIDSDAYKFNIQDNVEFWRELMEGIYTQEAISEFDKTLDINLLTYSEPNAPDDLIIPLRAD